MEMVLEQSNKVGAIRGGMGGKQVIIHGCACRGKDGVQNQVGSLMKCKRVANAPQEGAWKKQFSRCFKQKIIDSCNPSLPPKLTYQPDT